jgi:outer membrane protein assembly factor BamB
LEGDRGVLMCFAESDGAFLWELVVPKMYEIKFSDWHRVGISSTPVVEGDRVYLVTNRCEVVCLDLAGLENGNQGPYRDEAAHMANPGDPPVKLTDRHADILWLADMVAEVGAKPHNASNCSVLVDGDLLYICTGNGVDWTHSRVMNPEAPTLIVLDKKTGRVLARDDFGIGPNIIHGQWSSPSLGVVDGKKCVFQGTGSGYLFAVRAMTPQEAEAARQGDEPSTLETIWKFNGHPRAQLQEVVPLEHFHDTHSYEVVANPVVAGERLYVMFTQELYHKMPLGWLVCLDTTGKGDTTRTGGLIWGYDDVSSSGSTVSIADGLLYIADSHGKLHCLDAETGQPCWVHDVGGPIWGSTLVADGKVFLGTGRRGFWIFRHGREKEILHECTMPDKILSTPTAANGTLYVTVFKTLYAIADEKK